MTADEVEALFEQLIALQRAKVVSLARRIAPEITEEDLLQPHDHPRLATSASFQFEDGVLAGLLSARAAFRARSSLS